MNIICKIHSYIYAKDVVSLKALYEHVCGLVGLGSHEVIKVNRIY